MEKFRIELRAVFYKEGRNWFAHCLEMDIIGHGRTAKRAFDMMNHALIAQITASIEDDNKSNIFMPADRKFFAMYAAGKDKANGVCIVTRNADKKPIVALPYADLRTREYLGSPCAFA